MDSLGPPKLRHSFVKLWKNPWDLGGDIKYINESMGFQEYQPLVQMKVWYENAVPTPSSDARCARKASSHEFLVGLVDNNAPNMQKILRAQTSMSWVRNNEHVQGTCYVRCNNEEVSQRIDDAKSQLYMGMLGVRSFPNFPMLSMFLISILITS